MTGRFAASIAKYSRRLVAGAVDVGRPADTAENIVLAAACTGEKPVDVHCAQPGDDVRSGNRGTPERVLRRPDPAQWSDEELIALHEAVALMFPRGPLTVSSLRTAIAHGRLGHARIAGRIYTTRGALRVFAECRTNASADGRGRPEVDWDAHLATLLPTGGRRG